MIRTLKPGSRALALATLIAAAQSPAVTAQGTPSIPAFLPLSHQVAETEALPIDGVWTISTIGKRIRIERGRAYAVDPWLHLFVLKVQKDMVVLRDFRRLGPGHYRADDLPLLGPATFTLNPNGNLNVHVQGSLGPVAYNLIQQQVDDPGALDAEIAALGGASRPPPEEPPDYPSDPEPEPWPESEPAPTPPTDGDSLADCRNLGIDPASGDVVCFD